MERKDARTDGIPDAVVVTLHSNAGKCAPTSKHCTQFPEFAGLLYSNPRQKPMQVKRIRASYHQKNPTGMPLARPILVA